MNAQPARALPNFAHEPLIELNARTFGLLIAAYAVLYCLSWALLVIWSHPGGSLDTRALIYTVIGLALPQLIAAIGGARMFLGDAGGKRVVLFAIALNLVYSIVLLLAAVYTDRLAGRGLVTDTALNIAIAAVVSYLVATSQFGRDAKGWRVVLSTIVTIVMCGGLVLYAGTMLYAGLLLHAGYLVG